MTKPTDPISLAILGLEAESKALQTMVALLLVASPEALAYLEKLEPAIGDLAIQFALTDAQIAKLQKTISRAVVEARQFRAILDQKS